MGLNVCKGNMYDFVTHTWNTVKGKCEHDCSYCYMKRFKNQRPVRFDAKELKTDLGSDNVIFVGSSNDMFSGNIKQEWIIKTIEHCNKFNNKYLFQTKCPSSYKYFYHLFPPKTILGTTIETNRYYENFFANGITPPEYRGIPIHNANQIGFNTMITIEPIMDFDLRLMVQLIWESLPDWVNIGADTGNNNLPEPSKEKVLALIEELKKFTEVRSKSNLSRLLK